MMRWWGCVVGCLLCLIAVHGYTTERVSAQSSESFPVQLQFGEDTEPPTVPQNLTAIPVASTQIDLAWDASSDDFGVAGYQVFRDQTQIATTTETEYIDTGLQASTTYSYTVTAFDTSGNISTSSDAVATTTLAAPPPPPPEPDPEDPEDPDEPRRQSGSAPLPTLVDLSVEVGSEVARLQFRTSVPTQYTLRYGESEAGADGFSEAVVYRTDHTTVLSDLRPSTTYQYALYVTDRYGREVLVREDSFTTEPRFTVEMPSNVRSFSAQALGNDVFLRWQLPVDDSVAYVRVVRSSRFFPADPFDGTVVYQGPGTSYTDAGAMRGHDSQYYTIFTYNLQGVPSSGVIAEASRRPVSPPEVVPDPPTPDPPATTTPTTTPQPEEPPIISRNEAEVIQNDRVQTLADEAVRIDAETAFVLRIPAASLPTRTRLVTMTLWRPETDAPPLTFLLRQNEAGTYYTAALPGLAETGTYDLQLGLFDGANERFFALAGLLEVEEPEVSPSTVSEEPLLIGIGYLLAGGALGLLVALSLYWLILLLWRWWYRRSGTTRRY